MIFISQINCHGISYSCSLRLPPATQNNIHKKPGPISNVFYISHLPHSCLIWLTVFPDSTFKSLPVSRQRVSKSTIHKSIQSFLLIGKKCLNCIFQTFMYINLNSRALPAIPLYKIFDTCFQSHFRLVLTCGFEK